MKIVSAKCPSCGAQIEVDENGDKTKCEYCNSQIIVEEAIAKYKVEISGEVEVKNAPKMDNLLKLAERYYNDGEYDEAYDKYKKIVELDPDNCIGILRLSISKLMNKELQTIEIFPVVNAINNIDKLINDNEEFRKISEECYKHLVKKQNNLIAYYEKNTKFLGHNTLRRENAEKYFNILSSYSELYNNLYLIDLRRNNETNYQFQIVLIQERINTINKMVYKEIKYAYYYDRTLKFTSYNINKETKKVLQEERYKCVMTRNKLQEKYNIQSKKETVPTSTNNPAMTWCYIMAGFCQIIFFAAKFNKAFLSGIIAFLCTIIYIYHLIKILCTKFKWLKTVVLILRILLPILLLIFIGIGI